MRWDAEKGFAHNYECGDIEDKIGGEIMEVLPIVKHQSTDKWMKRESQPMDEVCEKHNPLMGLGGRDDLPFCRKSVSNLLG